MSRKTCKSPGSLVTIQGKVYCVGEKIQSKWKHSRLNKTKKNNTKTKKTKSKTSKST